MCYVERVVAFVALILVSPILITVLIIVFFHDFRNPIYQSLRVGLNGDLFYLYKVRSMRMDNRLPIRLATASNDPRLFSFGKLIRRFKIDELPQLFNVVIGKMNLVGPRPNIVELVKLYQDEEFSLLKTKPGLTDLASVVLAHYNNELAKVSDPDLFYHKSIKHMKTHYSLLSIKKKSLAFNLFVIFATIGVLVAPILSRKILEHYGKNIKK